MKKSQLKKIIREAITEQENLCGEFLDVMQNDAQIFSYCDACYNENYGNPNNQFANPAYLSCPPIECCETSPQAADPEPEGMPTIPTPPIAGKESGGPLATNLPGQINRKKRRR